MSAIERIAAERARHTDELGYTPEHDAEHGEERLLLRGAIYYAARELGFTTLEVEASAVAPDWPFSSHGADALVKAASLLAAEVDRMEAVGGLRCAICGGDRFALCEGHKEHRLVHSDEALAQGRIWCDDGHEFKPEAVVAEPTEEAGNGE